MALEFSEAREFASSFVPLLDDLDVAGQVVRTLLKMKAAGIWTFGQALNPLRHRLDKPSREAICGAVSIRHFGIAVANRTSRTLTRTAPLSRIGYGMAIYRQFSEDPTA